MMRFNRCRLGLAVALGALALAANAQPATHSQGTTAPAAQSAKGSSAAQSGHAAKSSTTHATKRSTSHGASKASSSANRAHAGREGDMAESAYKSALRRCVAGPESGRDACLDQAIAQHGRA